MRFVFCRKKILHINRNCVVGRYHALTSYMVLVITTLPHSNLSRLCAGILMCAVSKDAV